MEDPQSIEEFLNSLQVLKNEYEATTQKLATSKIRKQVLLGQIQTLKEEKQTLNTSVTQMYSKGGELSAKYDNLVWCIECKKKELELIKLQVSELQIERNSAQTSYDTTRGNSLDQMASWVAEKMEYRNYKQVLESRLSNVKIQVLDLDTSVDHRLARLRELTDRAKNPLGQIDSIDEAIRLEKQHLNDINEQHKQLMEKYEVVKKDRDRVSEEFSCISQQYTEAKKRVDDVQKDIQTKREQQKNNQKHLKDLATSIQSTRLKMQALDQQITFAEQDKALEEVLDFDRTPVSQKKYTPNFTPPTSNAQSSNITSLRSKSSQYQHPYFPRKETLTNRFNMRGSMPRSSTHASPGSVHFNSPQLLKNIPRNSYSSSKSDEDDELLDIDIMKTIGMVSSSTERNPFVSAKTLHQQKSVLNNNGKQTEVGSEQQNRNFKFVSVRK